MDLIRLDPPRRFRTPVVRGTAAKTSVTTTLSVAQVDFSVAPQAGDQLIAFCNTVTDDPDLGSTGFATPAGWASVGALGGVLGIGLIAGATVFQKTAGSSEGTYAFNTGGTTQSSVVHVIAVAGATLLDHAAVNPTGQTNNTTSKTTPALTVYQNNSLLLSSWMASYTAGGAGVWTPPGSMTKYTDTSAGPGALGLTVASAWEALSASGSTGTRTGTWSKASPDVTMGASVALRGIPR